MIVTNSSNATGASIAGLVSTQDDIKKHAHHGYGDVGQCYRKYRQYYIN